MIRRTNQGGSVATFAVIGIIFALVLVGSIYLLNQHTKQVRENQSIAENRSDYTDKKSSENNKPKTISTDNSSKNTAKKTVQTQNIPTSGPELSAIELSEIFLLTVFSTAYLMSHRMSKRSL